MSFLNPALAWGACAAAIPLILHILNRSRFRRVEWGAMHLLESVVKVCLLYTSPSPRDLSTSRMPSSA